MLRGVDLRVGVGVGVWRRKKLHFCSTLFGVVILLVLQRLFVFCFMMSVSNSYNTWKGNAVSKIKEMVQSFT